MYMPTVLPLTARMADNSTILAFDNHIAGLESLKLHPIINIAGEGFNNCTKAVIIAKDFDLGIGDSDSEKMKGAIQAKELGYLVLVARRDQGNNYERAFITALFHVAHHFHVRITKSDDPYADYMYFDLIPNEETYKCVLHKMSTILNENTRLFLLEILGALLVSPEYEVPPGAKWSSPEEFAADHIIGLAFNKMYKHRGYLCAAHIRDYLECKLVEHRHASCISDAARKADVLVDDMLTRAVMGLNNIGSSGHVCHPKDLANYYTP